MPVVFNLLTLPTSHVSVTTGLGQIMSAKIYEILCINDCEQFLVAHVK